MRRALSLFLFLLLAAPVAAVGFGNPPTQREFIFSPGLSFSVPIIVINGERIRVSLDTPTPGNPDTIGTPEDDNILEYVSLDDPAPETGQREVRVVFELPQQMRPGVYQVDVYATDQPGGGAGIAAVATVKLRLTVRVLSPEKLIDIEGLVVPTVAEGLQANATVRFVSRTTQDIDRVVARFQVMDGEQQVASGVAAPRGLRSAEQGSSMAYLDTERLAGGEYPVFVTLEYDGKEVRGGPVVLKIGTLHVSIPEHTQELLYNATNKFVFNVSNQWNRELKDVYAFVRAGSQMKKTASLNIPPFGKQQYEVYFDRDEGLAAGPTELNITVAFKDFNPTSQSYVDKEESFLVPVLVVAPVEEPQGYGAWVLAGAALLFVVLLLLFLARRRRQEVPAQ